MTGQAGQPKIRLKEHMLHGTFAWDNSGLVRALDLNSTEDDAPIAQLVWRSILAHRDSQILVPAPTFAEFLHKRDRRWPRVSGVHVVPYDQDCAYKQVEHITPTIPDGDSRSSAYWKVDHMILSVALANNVKWFVSADKNQRARAQEIGLRAVSIYDFVDDGPSQGVLFE